MTTLALASARSGGHFASTAWRAMPADEAQEWLPLREVLAPELFGAVVGGTAAMLDAETNVAAALVARALTALVVGATIDTWSRERRVLDVTVDNLMVRSDGLDAHAALVDVRGWALAESVADDGDTFAVVADDDELRARLERTLFDDFVAAVVAAVRGIVRSGQRHLWGNAGLAVANTLATTSHEVGRRADDDRAAVLADRPDLAGTVQIETVPDGTGGSVTFAIRRTCCLLYKVPDAAMCGTCSLRPESERIDACVTYYRAERDRSRARPAE
jgi:ferric iron reductase protein FhuF